MDWRIIVGLIGFGIVVGFVIRSSLGFLLKVAVVLVALAVFHVVSPDGIPEMVRQGLEWAHDKIRDEAADALPKR